MFICDLQMLVECTIVVKHEPSFRPGKYGLTVSQPTPYGTNVLEVKGDEELFAIFLELGYPAVRIYEILEELAPVNSAFTDRRLIDEGMLDKYGFCQAS